jgi:hypothetical protein
MRPGPVEVVKVEAGVFESTVDSADAAKKVNLFL